MRVSDAQCTVAGRVVGGGRTHAMRWLVHVRALGGCVYVRWASVRWVGCGWLASYVGGLVVVCWWLSVGGWVYIGHRPAVGGCTLYLRWMCGRVSVGRLCGWVVGGDVYGMLLALI